ncbi:alpha/beta fold hydrolase [Thermodesulfobacteriota bacterium]
MEDLFVKSGTITMHALKCGNDNQGPIIFIHGYVASSWWWRDLMKGMENDFTTYALDMRGCGETDKLRDGYSPDQMAADVAAFMDDLKIESAIIVGHSMGGYIAQALALNHPEKVKKLVLVCTAPTGENHPGLAFVAMDASLHPDITFEWMRASMDMLFGEPAADPLRDKLAGEALKACRDAYLQQMASLTITNMSDRLETISVPTLVIVGKQDRFSPDPSPFEAIPNITIEIFEQSSHVPMFQEAEKFKNIISNFAR